jgi:hypothetical protein
VVVLRLWQAEGVVRQHELVEEDLEQHFEWVVAVQVL